MDVVTLVNFEKAQMIFVRGIDEPFPASQVPQFRVTFGLGRISVPGTLIGKEVICWRGRNSRRPGAEM